MLSERGHQYFAGALWVISTSVVAQKEHICSLADKVIKVTQPAHVEALVLVEGHAFNERTHVLVDAKTFQVLDHRCLDALIKRGKVRAGVLTNLTLKSVQFLLLSYVR